MKYSYVALDSFQKKVIGEVEAESTKVVANILREQKLFPVTINEGSSSQKKDFDFKNIFSRISLVEKIVFIKNLSVMLKAGFPISKALGTLALQTENLKWKKILLDITNKVESGQTLADSISKYPDVFSSVFVNVIHIGEISGNMDQSLADLGVQLEKDHELVRKAKGAMIYPSIVVSAMIIITALMFTFVMPKLTELFKDFNVELPLLTRILIAMADFMKNYGIFVLLFIVFLIISIFFLNKSPKFIKKRDKFFLKIPTFGKMIRDTNTARMCRTLSSLLKSGMSILESIKVTGDSLGNYEYRNALSEVEAKIRNGEKLAVSLKSYPKLFQPLVIDMISVGEESGNIDTVLVELSDFYEGEVNQKVGNLSSILEPVLMLVVGVGVGIIAVGLVLPIYSISQGV